MPCRVYDDGDYAAQSKADLDRATRLLCKMVAHFGVIPGDQELAVWKAQHDEMDRRRLAAEQAAVARAVEEQRKEQLRAQAEAKLTAEELEALKGR